MPKVLVANRGESEWRLDQTILYGNKLSQSSSLHLVAIRILRSARELEWETVSVYTEGDESHATFADEAVKLDEVSDFLNTARIVSIAERYVISD